MSAISTLKSKSIRARFFFAFAANSVRFAMSFLSGIFVARALGPAEFGNFNFLLASFTSIFQLLDMGSSTAFYTFISRRKRVPAFYFYYLAWMAIQFVIALLLATVLLPAGMRQKIWLGHGTGIVVLSLFASFSMNQLWQLVTQAGESIRATVTVQAFNVAIAALYIIAVLAMIRLDIMTVGNLFVFIAIAYLVFTLLLSRRLKGKLVDYATEETGFGNVFREFKSYCYPLILNAWIGFAYVFADNWLLQRFGGAAEQGFYSIGYRFTLFAGIATTSMLQIFWKEIAEASEKRDMETIERLTRKLTKILYFTGALLSCFLIPFSKELLAWLLGPSFEAGWLCLAIMLLYPMPQAVGQIRATVFLGLGMTAAYMNYGVAIAAVSIPLTYFALAPAGAWGLDLASTGIALKTVIVTFVGVNVMGWMLSRMLGWKSDFWFQLIVVSVLLFISFIVKLATAWLLGAVLAAVSVPALLAGSMLLYIVAAAAFVYAFPTLIGLERGELKSMYERVKASVAAD